MWKSHWCTLTRIGRFAREVPYGWWTASNHVRRRVVPPTFQAPARALLSSSANRLNAANALAKIDTEQSADDASASQNEAEPTVDASIDATAANAPPDPSASQNEAESAVDAPIGVSAADAPSDAPASQLDAEFTVDASIGASAADAPSDAPASQIEAGLTAAASIDATATNAPSDVHPGGCGSQQAPPQGKSQPADAASPTSHPEPPRTGNGPHGTESPDNQDILAELQRLRGDVNQHHIESEKTALKLAEIAEQHAKTQLENEKLRAELERLRGDGKQPSVVTKNTAQNPIQAVDQYSDMVREIERESRKIERERKEKILAIRAELRKRLRLVETETTAREVEALEVYSSSISQARKKRREQSLEALRQVEEQEARVQAEFKTALERVEALIIRNMDPANPRNETIAKAGPAASKSTNTSMDEASIATQREPRHAPIGLNPSRLGPPAHRINLQNLEPVPVPVTWTEGQYMCSYTMHSVSEDGYTLDVPGYVPKFALPSLPIRLPHDPVRKADEFGFWGATHHEDLFRAIAAMDPSLRLSNLDVITDSSVLMRLFLITRSPGALRLDWLHIQLVGEKTIILSSLRDDRVHPLKRKFWPLMKGQNTGYGFTFENNFTHRPLDAASRWSEHYRTIRYTMGSLNIAVRFQVDAYYDGPEASSFRIDAPTGIPGPGTPLPEFPQFYSLRTRSPSDSKAPRVINKGSIIAQSKMAELKSGSMSRNHPTKLIANLWFSRISHLVELPPHTNGEVRSLEYTNSDALTRKFETVHNDSLRKVVSWLTQLQDIAKAEREKHGPRLSLVCGFSNASMNIHLVQREAEDEDFVSPSRIQQHWGKNTQELKSKATDEAPIISTAPATSATPITPTTPATAASITTIAPTVPTSPNTNAKPACQDSKPESEPARLSGYRPAPYLPEDTPSVDRFTSSEESAAKPLGKVMLIKNIPPEVTQEQLYLLFEDQKVQLPMNFAYHPGIDTPGIAFALWIGADRWRRGGKRAYKRLNGYLFHGSVLEVQFLGQPKNEKHPAHPESNTAQYPTTQSAMTLPTSTDKPPSIPASTHVHREQSSEAHTAVDLPGSSSLETSLDVTKSEGNRAVVTKTVIELERRRVSQRMRRERAHLEKIRAFIDAMRKEILEILPWIDIPDGARYSGPSLKAPKSEDIKIDSTGQSRYSGPSLKAPVLEQAKNNSGEQLATKGKKETRREYQRRRINDLVQASIRMEVSLMSLRKEIIRDLLPRTSLPFHVPRLIKPLGSAQTGKWERDMISAWLGKSIEMDGSIRRVRREIQRTLPRTSLPFYVPRPIKPLESAQTGKWESGVIRDLFGKSIEMDGYIRRVRREIQQALPGTAIPVFLPRLIMPLRTTQSAEWRSWRGQISYFLKESKHMDDSIKNVRKEIFKVLPGAAIPNYLTACVRHLGKSSAQNPGKHHSPTSMKRHPSRTFLRIKLQVQAANVNLAGN